MEKIIEESLNDFLKEPMEKFMKEPLDYFTQEWFEIFVMVKRPWGAREDQQSVTTRTHIPEIPYKKLWDIFLFFSHFMEFLINATISKGIRRKFSIEIEVEILRKLYG